MPTKAQVTEAVALAQAVDPGARIKRVGPDGVEFDYPNAGAVEGGSGFATHSAAEAAAFRGKPLGRAS